MADDIPNLESARLFFIDKCREHGIRVFRTIPTAPRKIGYWFETSAGRFCVTHKRDFYHAFDTHFPEVAPMGYGQVGNRMLIDRARQLNAFMVMVMPSGLVYIVHARIWWTYWQTELGGREVPHLDGEIALPLVQFYNFDEWASGKPWEGY